jgi:predicted aminopeptidase
MNRADFKTTQDGAQILLLNIMAAFIILFTVGGCAGPGYYSQAVAGQWRLMRDRVSIDEVLMDPQTDSLRADQLRHVRQILEFAESELQLPAGDSYDSFVATGRKAVVWNVVAAPEFSLSPRKWCFIVAGCVPYRGYFDQNDAVRFSQKLQGKGLDSTVSPAAAYSTLGWFSDPLLDTMLRRSGWQLAAYLFHELAHRKLYVRGDTNFNEAYARQVERIGIEAWLREKKHANDREQWSKAEKAAGEFQKLLTGTREDLVGLYTSGISREQMRLHKQEILDALRIAYGSLRDQQWNGHDYFGAWFDQPINNASIALLQSYEGGRCAFHRLFNEAAQSPAQFHSLAEKMGSLDQEERTRWLEQACSAVASSGHL